MARIRPALDLVEHAERLWSPDKELAALRARAIVNLLIRNGFLQGTVEREIPVAPVQVEG